MEADGGYQESPAGSPLSAAGIAHVCLSYHYLDHDDIDGYLSLLDADISLQLPSRREIRGREQVAAFQARPEQHACRLLIREVAGCGDLVVVEGRYVPGRGGEGVDFTEVFRISRDGLLRSQKRYYFLEPDDRTVRVIERDKPGAGG